MNVTIFPKKLCGNVNAIPSKSQAHRFLICAAFSDSDTRIFCSETNQDIESTAACLNALGAHIIRKSWGYQCSPIHAIPKSAILNCGESGSTLRFLLPIAGAFGVDAHFQMSGRLPSRPISPLWEEMERMGCQLSRPVPSVIHCTGKLKCGEYILSGGVSSQFITGLLFALSLLDGSSQIKIDGCLESAPYIEMTQQAMTRFGVHTDSFKIHGKAHYCTPGDISVEGDWSNGAFFLSAAELGNHVKVWGLNDESAQGDKMITVLLPLFSEKCTVSGKDIPDLIPILAVIAGAKKGAVFTDIHRLRMKESDRVASTVQMIQSLGGSAWADENQLYVLGTGYCGGTVDAMNDHRIAMSAAIAATVCSQPVTVCGAECVSKSYPLFWKEYQRLGGQL